MINLEYKATVDVSQAVEAQDTLGKGIEANTEAVDGMTSSLDKMTGGAITSFKGIVSGARAGVVAMTTLKGAIAATGIGLLIVAVGSLVSYFSSTQEGADKLNQAFAVVGATVDVLVDRLSMLGDGIVKFFSGDVSGAMDSFKESTKGIVEEIQNESVAAYDLEIAFQALQKRKIDFIVTEKKLRAEIEAAKLASEDFNLSVEERFAANQKASRLERKLATERADQVKEELRIITERNALGESLNDDLEKQRTLEAELFQIESDRDTRLKELVGKQRTLTDELQKQLDLQKEIEGSLEMEQMQAINPTELSSAQSLELQQKEYFNKLKLKTDQELADAAEKINAESSEVAIKMEEQKQAAIRSMISQGFAAASLIAGENAQAQKGIAASQAVISTYTAIAGSLAQYSGVGAPPIPGYAIAQAIATGVFGFAQVAKILSTNVGLTSSPSMSSPSVNTSVPEQSNNSDIPNFDFINNGVGGNAGSSLNRNYFILQDIKNQEVLRDRIQDISKIA